MTAEGHERRWSWQNLTRGFPKCTRVYADVKRERQVGFLAMIQAGPRWGMDPGSATSDRGFFSRPNVLSHGSRHPPGSRRGAFMWGTEATSGHTSPLAQARGMPRATSIRHGGRGPRTRMPRGHCIVWICKSLAKVRATYERQRQLRPSGQPSRCQGGAPTSHAGLR